MEMCEGKVLKHGQQEAIGKRKAQEGYEAIAAHPDLYTGEGMLNAARITSKFGFIFSFVGIAYWIIYGIYFAALFSNL